MISSSMVNREVVRFSGASLRIVGAMAFLLTAFPAPVKAHGMGESAGKITGAERTQFPTSTKTSDRPTRETRPHIDPKGKATLRRQPTTAKKRTTQQGTGAMECFLLGSGGMMPTEQRNLPAMALRHDGRVYLFDAGEGTQNPYKRAKLSVRDLDVVAITHNHADHILGLPGILMLRANMPNPQPLTVLGPPKVRDFVNDLYRNLDLYQNFPINFVEWRPDVGPLAYENKSARIYWHPLDHTVPCVGYRFEERDRPGRFDAEAAERFGIPKGPLFGALQAGKTVQGKNGPVTPEQVIGESRRGRRVAYVTDTGMTHTLQPLLKEVDLAFLEGMFAPEDAAKAAKKKHLTVEQASKQAQQAGAKQVVLIHTSPRYEAAEVPSLEKAAQKHHSNITVGNDGQIFDIPLPD